MQFKPNFNEPCENNHFWPISIFSTFARCNSSQISMNRAKTTTLDKFKNVVICTV
jgi:hypothetical protein